MRDKVAPNRTAPPEGPRRRPYRTPRLERLGTLTELTAASGNSTNKTDHAGPGAPLRKTS